MTTLDPIYLNSGRPLYPEPPPDPPRRDNLTGDPLIDAAITGYEKAWPDAIWETAPKEHRRVWIELMAVHLVERTGPFAETP